MKVLNINQFIYERVKIKPVTNAELDKIQKNMIIGLRKIENPSPEDIKPGMTVCIDEKYGIDWYIVFDGGNLPNWINAHISDVSKGAGNLLFIRYCNNALHKYAYWKYHSFRTNFPYHYIYHDTKIIGVYDTKINTVDIKSAEALRNILNDIRTKIIK